MEEWLLLDGVELKCGYVPARDAKRSAFIEADFADPDGAWRNLAEMAAGVATQPVSIELLDKFGRCRGGASAECVFQGDIGDSHACCENKAGVIENPDWEAGWV